MWAWHGSDHAVGSGDTLQALLEPSMMTVLESCHLTKLSLTGSAGAMVFCEAEPVIWLVRARKDDLIELLFLEHIFEQYLCALGSMSQTCLKHMSRMENVFGV